MVVRDSRAREARKGCDFEMWIGSDKRGWSRYAVQAKKVSVSTGRYESLNHSVSGKPQIDILNLYAKRVGAAPIYCLYNFYDCLPDWKYRCPLWNCGLPVDRFQLGCSVTPARVIKSALQRRGMRSFLSIHSEPETIPWRCLLRCAGPHRYDHEASMSHRPPTRWPDPEEFYYEDLPPQVQALRESVARGLEFQLEDDVNWGRDEPLHPGWTAIVDIGLDE